MEPRHIIIDCDPGVDDAVALLLAFGAPEQLVILGVTTVAGNVPLARTARNACIIREIAGARQVPIYAGCPVPIVRAPVLAEDFHGADGLGDIGLVDDHSKDLRIEPLHGVSFLIETLRAAPLASITIVMMGPLTNLAMALVMAPEIVAAIEEIVIMGGARREGGNVTPSAEYNFFADPHAASAVLGSGAPICLIGLDATHQLRATDDRIAKIAGLGTRQSDVASQLLNFCNQIPANLEGGQGAPLHDPATIAYLLVPQAFKTVPARVQVEVNSELTLGSSAVDLHSTQPSARWVTHIDADQVFELLQHQFGPK